MPRKPATTKKTAKAVAREKKRAKVAADVVAGKPTKEIAAELGCTARNVQQIVAEPETQFLITQAMAPHAETLRGMLPMVMQSLEEALRAEKGDTADHFTRLRAIERHGELMELAQGKPREESQASLQLITADQFVLITGRPLAKED